MASFIFRLPFFFFFFFLKNTLNSKKLFQIKIISLTFDSYEKLVITTVRTTTGMAGTNDFRRQRINSKTKCANGHHKFKDESEELFTINHKTLLLYP
jgi:hypothetical protein